MAVIAVTVAATETAKSKEDGVPSVVVAVTITPGRTLLASITITTAMPGVARVDYIKGGGDWSLLAFATSETSREELWSTGIASSTEAAEILVGLIGVTDQAKVSITELVDCKSLHGVSLSCSADVEPEVKLAVRDLVAGDKQYALGVRTSNAKATLLP